MQLINYFIAKKARGLTFNREGSKIPQVKSKLAGQISHLLTLCNIICFRDCRITLFYYKNGNGLFLASVDDRNRHSDHNECEKNGKIY